MVFQAEKFPLNLTRNPPYVSNEEFRKYIRGVLTKITDIDPENIQRWTSSAYAEEWEQSRMHSTYSSQRSYETVEFFGDKLANSLVALYISKTYPQVYNTEWVTKLQNYLHSADSFMQPSYMIGLYKFVLISQEAWEIHIQKPENMKYLGDYAVWENQNWRKLLTDMFEAFIGTIFRIVYKDQGFIGVAYEVISKVFFYYISKIYVDLSVQFLWDPVTILKESLELKRKDLGIPINSANPRYNFKKSLLQETKEILEPDGTVNHVEFRYSLNLPNPRDQGTGDYAMPFVTVVQGIWSPNDTTAKNDAAEKGLIWWKSKGNKIVQKPAMNDKKVWKPSRV